MKEFLKYVDISELHEKICIFRGLDFKKLNYREIQDEISKVICFETSKGLCTCLTQLAVNYPTGTRFYRVRNIEKGDTSLPLNSMSRISDCWEPPIEFINNDGSVKSLQAGRLNKERESLLYTAPLSPHVAIEEMKIRDDQLFSLIVYEALEPIQATSIGHTPYTHGLSDDEILKLKMIQSFLRDEFTRDVGYGTEYLYKISEFIAKDYFDLPPSEQDAWHYPSVAKKGDYNVCFRPSVKQKLSLVGVQIAMIRRNGDGYLYNPKLIAKDSGNGNDLSYHRIGSPEQKSLFPELTPEVV